MLNTTDFIIGIDFGQKKMGVSVGQCLTGQAKPLATLPVQAGTPSWDALDKLVDQWLPQAFVIGDPLHEDGTPSTLSQKVYRFKEKLQARYDKPVHLINEHLSSSFARVQVRENPKHHAKKKGWDGLQAVVILESWLNEMMRNHA